MRLTNTSSSPPVASSVSPAIVYVVSAENVAIAPLADKMTVIRSMSHGEAAHERGTHNMFTGYRPSPALLYPSMGSVVSHEFGPRKNLPPYVCIPNAQSAYSGPGYLSSSFAPFSLGDDPATSVVDRYSIAHESPNLVVLGGSTFPNTTGYNPTETIQTLAWFAADNLARNFQTIAG